MGSMEKYIKAMRDAGIPRDQAELFLRIRYVASPKQLCFHAAARSCDEPDGPVIVGFGGARGGGKSHTSVIQLADDAMRLPNARLLFLRSYSMTASQSFDDLRMKAYHSVPHDYVSNEVRFPNGAKIMMGGFKDNKDIDKYIGIEYDVILIEEATLLSKYKVNSLRGSLRSSKPGWRPRLYLTTNPGGEGHAWFKEMIVTPYRRKKETTTRFIPSLAIDNPFVGKEYHDYLDSQEGYLRRAWRDGDWDVASGQYFINFREKDHVKEFKAERHWEYWLAMDYGYVHYNVVYLFGKDGDGNLYVIDELAEQRATPETVVPEINEMLKRHRIKRGHLRTFVAGGDLFSERSGSVTLSDKYKQFGYEVERANMRRIAGAMEITDRLGNPRRGREPRLFIHERCVRLTECLPNLQHDDKRPEDVKKVDVDSDGVGGDDAYDAFRYGVMVDSKEKIAVPQSFSFYGG